MVSGECGDITQTGNPIGAFVGLFCGPDRVFFTGLAEPEVALDKMKYVCSVEWFLSGSFGGIVCLALWCQQPLSRNGRNADAG